MSNPSGEQYRTETPPWYAHMGFIIACGCIISMVTFGTRASFGLFNAPITDTYGWPREVFGFAIALQNLMWGFGQPIAGAIADRYGTARVLMGGAVVYAAGVALMAVSDTPFLFYLSGGLLVGIGISTASFAIVMAAFSRRVPEERRPWAFGIATSASSLGQFLFAPLGQAFITAYGWPMALILLSIILLAVIPLAIPMRGKSSEAGSSSLLEPELPLRGALSWAFGHTSYVLLVFGFFVCGFQIAFITTHMPPFLTEIGLSPSLAAWSIGLVGLFNIIGSYFAGVLGMHYSKRYLLSSIYFLRAVAIVLFLTTPITATTTLLFSAFMGLLWLSTVPLTAGLVAVMFGTRYMGMLYGLVFLSHQVGSFIGVWLGGIMYDTTGSYDLVWWLSVGLGVFAGIVHLPIREQKAPAYAGP